MDGAHHMQTLQVNSENSITFTITYGTKLNVMINYTEQVMMNIFQKIHCTDYLFFIIHTFTHLLSLSLITCSFCQIFYQPQGTHQHMLMKPFDARYLKLDLPDQPAVCINLEVYGCRADSGMPSTRDAAFKFCKSCNILEPYLNTL